MTQEVARIAQNARAAAMKLKSLDTQSKNKALERMAAHLENSFEFVCSANNHDAETARSLVSSGKLAEATFARLALTQEKLEQMVRSIRTVATLDDPVGRILLQRELDEGLNLKKITCPFGVLAAVIEARPEAVVQLAALALKSGNSLIIKTGAEIANTADCLIAMFQETVHFGLQVPRAVFTHIQGRDRFLALLKLDEYVDLVIPRGGAELIRFVSANTRIPVLSHADGVCHIYVDTAADLELALPVIVDSKVQAPSTCNAVETVLVAQPIAVRFLPLLLESLERHNVRVRGCEITRRICGKRIELVEENQWHTEYGSLVLGVRVIEGYEAAVDHINRFGSHHTDSIITENADTAKSFLQDVDSAGVFHNASTRFSDGYRYGLGAEVGISTSKLHARGPVGLEGLVTHKYLLSGTGQCVSQYLGPAARGFRHEPES